VPAPDDQLISQYQQLYKPPQFNITIAPHITLARPAESSLTEVEAAKIFSSYTTKLPDFKVEVEGVGTFLHPENSTVYAAPILTAELTEIHEFALTIHEQICKPFKETYAFHPHISIVKDLLPEQAKILEQALQKENIRFSYVLDRIFLLKKDNHDDFWQDIAELKLA
jgi:2'-5' RNA ligase